MLLASKGLKIKCSTMSETGGFVSKDTPHKLKEYSLVMLKEIF